MTDKLRHKNGLTCQRENPGLPCCSGAALRVLAILHREEGDTGQNLPEFTGPSVHGRQHGDVVGSRSASIRVDSRCLERSKGSEDHLLPRRIARGHTTRRHPGEPTLRTETANSRRLQRRRLPCPDRRVPNISLKRVYVGGHSRHSMPLFQCCAWPSACGSRT